MKITFELTEDILEDWVASWFLLVFGMPTLELTENVIEASRLVGQGP